MAPQRTAKEIEDAYVKSLKFELGIAEEDPLPSEEELEQIFKQYPNLVDKARKEGQGVGDRPSLTITKEGIALALPNAKTRISMAEKGMSVQGKVDNEQNPQEPMNPVGIGSVPMPMDLLPQGNVMVPHPKRLPAIDDILTMGVMVTRFVKTIKSMGKIIKSMQDLKE